MGTFLVFVRKCIYCCFCVDEDKESEPPSYRYQKIPQKSICADFHGSGVSTSQLSSNNSANTRGSEEGTKNGHPSAEKNQLVTKRKKRNKQKKDPAIEKVPSADSSVCSVPDSSQSGSTSINRDFYGGSVSASQLSSSNSANTRGSEEGTKNGHQSAEKNQLSVQFSEPAIKKVSSADLSVCSVPDFIQFGSTSINKDFHGSSVSASQLSSNNSANTRGSEEGTKNGHPSAEKNQLVTKRKKRNKQKKDPAIEKVPSADSSVCSVPDSSQSGSTSINRDFYGGSVSASQLSSNNSANTRGSEEGTKNGHQSAEKNQLSVQFSDPAIKKVSSADSSVCSVPDFIQFGSYSSEGKGTCLQKATTKPHWYSMESKKIALDEMFAMNACSWNSLNDQLPSSSSHCGHLTERSYDELMDALTIAWFQSERSDLPEEQILYHIREFLGRLNPGKKVSMASLLFTADERKIQDYCSSQKVLLVGEGDFSFSACLAKAFGSATNMVATSLNSEEYLRKYYGNAMYNISQLRVRGCRVLHEVDATDLANHGIIKDLKFDRIIYNFPHCGDFLKSEDALRKNQSLVGLFMESSAKLICKDGEIHIRHKCNWFFGRWNLRQLASEAGLRLREETPFDASVFEGYTTKYGFEGGKFKSDNDFDCHSSRTYKFVLHQKKLRKKKNKPNA